MRQLVFLDAKQPQVKIPKQNLKPGVTHKETTSMYETIFALK